MQAASTFGDAIRASRGNPGASRALSARSGGENSAGKQSFAMIGRNYMSRRLLLPDPVTAIMMAGAKEDANANFFSKP
jgi:hypothetical protein